ncbi:23S rRNA pseudouridine(1911/1915/1917) synthase RluD [Coxiella endosymbiont of Amblyomma nuttalli]|uniref:23S rRNA pseudouridine(1911/1915/1917) synthase RluD n=1 Tax=Coxiella endosymbiont of Amblyomma nuttalli TaxID=2749996 RepID=UPI001BAC2D82|nr:23S rRNA pseudouridine(1911/1915/1917) synthase RluD [Coxiella endosymbiont of Amblyomma nuttalli]QTS84121.1 Ribosomal large subunit pseudouridine synthase D [Coxiella endosymbiont of Amblyomma nuttalli]
MSSPQKIVLKNVIPAGLNRTRLDQALVKLFPDYSRSQLRNWIQAGYVTVNNQKKILAKETVQTNQVIKIIVQLKPSKPWIPQSIPLDIIYEDEAIFVINKPPGLVVHPGAGIPDHTLANALLYYDPYLAVIPRAGMIHRLDRDTCGLLIIARTLIAYLNLTNAMKMRQITREYEAIVKGILISGQVISAPIGRHPTNRTRMAVVASGGRSATTHFRIVHRYRAHTHIRLRLDTGRTHQIRVHMAHIHHPLVGDPVYGTHISSIPHCLSTPLKTALRALHRQALYASTLRFIHPITQQPMECHTPLPKDMVYLIQCLNDDEQHHVK